MNKINIVKPNEVLITGTNLEQANLSEFGRLEILLLDYAAVVIPGDPGGMERFPVVQDQRERQRPVPPGRCGRT